MKKVKEFKGVWCEANVVTYIILKKLGYTLEPLTYNIGIYVFGENGEVKYFIVKPEDLLGSEIVLVDNEFYYKDSIESINEEVDVADEEIYTGNEFDLSITGEDGRLRKVTQLDCGITWKITIERVN